MRPFDKQCTILQHKGWFPHGVTHPLSFSLSVLASFPACLSFLSLLALISPSPLVSHSCLSLPLSLLPLLSLILVSHLCLSFPSCLWLWLYTLVDYVSPTLHVICPHVSLTTFSCHNSTPPPPKYGFNYSLFHITSTLLSFHAQHL